MKALAIAAPERSAFLPELPTFTELGYPAVAYDLWFGLFAPAGTPRAVVDRVHRDVARILADPGVDAQDLRAKGYAPAGTTPDAFDAHIRRELAARAAVVQLSGAKLE